MVGLCELCDELFDIGKVFGVVYNSAEFWGFVVGSGGVGEFAA